MPEAVPDELAAPVSGLPRDLLAGRGADLLLPLRFLSPGERPSGPPPAVDRSEIASALAVANLSYAHPRARELATKLADPETRVVISGQQTGLFGGPLLGLVKAAAAVRWAEALEAAGQSAVALFWMATEDHDWAEVASTRLPGAEGLQSFSLGADPQPLAPVGLRTLGAGVTEILAALERSAEPGARAWIERLSRLWRPDARFGEAFARQLVEILGARSPLFVDALLPELKRAEAPYLARLIERRHELLQLQAQAEAAITARGYPLQVQPQPGASPLFLLRQQERRRIEWRTDERFALRGAAGEESVAELLATVSDNPAVVSPGVLARPAIQDAVFGTTLQVVGPGELAYLVQATPAYELLALAAPWVALRPQAVVLDPRQERRRRQLGVALGELVADPDAARRRLGERSGGGFVAAVRDEIEGRLEALRAPALALDPTLERPFAKTQETVAHALGMFAAKVDAAAVRKNEVASRRLAQLEETVRPSGKPQERVVSTAHFVGRFGPAFGGALLDQLDLDPRRISVIVPESGPESAPETGPGGVAESGSESAP